LGIAVFDREREQGRFGGSTGGAGGSTEGAQREHRGSTEGAGGAPREQGEHEGRSLFWLLVLLPGSASCCLDSE